MPSDATTLAAIVDRLAIQDLLVRYCRAIDTKDWDLLDTVFVPDAHVDYTSSGGAQGPYPEVRAWLAQVLPNFPMSQHAVSNFEIEVTGDRAKSRAYFYNPMARPKPEGGVSLFFVGGYYVDELVRTADGWRITQRIEQQAWVDVRA
jgi:3-phenylpropionate/cinnamic acid dioxygenase small subunit